MPTLLLLTTLLGAPASDTTFAAIVREQLRRHPEMVITDLYKLAHQSTFGAEHAIVDSAAARQWLDREWSTMGTGPLESVYDTIAPEGTLVRLNLRAWRDEGGSPDVVLAAFLATGRVPMGSPDQFEGAWATVVSLASRKAIAFDADALIEYGQMMRARGYPAVGHSDAYRARSRPAYRVVRRDLVRSPTR